MPKRRKIAGPFISDQCWVIDLIDGNNIRSQAMSEQRQVHAMAEQIGVSGAGPACDVLYEPDQK